MANGRNISLCTGVDSVPQWGNSAAPPSQHLTSLELNMIL